MSDQIGRDVPCGCWVNGEDLEYRACKYSETLARAEKAEAQLSSLRAQYLTIFSLSEEQGVAVEGMRERIAELERSFAEFRSDAEAYESKLHAELNESESNLVLSGSLLQASGKRVADLEAKIAEAITELERPALYEMRVVMALGVLK